MKDLQSVATQTEQAKVQETGWGECGSEYSDLHEKRPKLSTTKSSRLLT